MAIIAQDSGNIPRLLLVDTSGKLVLGPSSEVIGSVNEARGKTILYNIASATNAATAVRTVTAGKTYYLVACGLSVHSTTNQADCYLYLTTTARVLLHHRAATVATYKTTDSRHSELSFPYPIPIAASTVIYVSTDDAGATAFGWIIGWEE